MCLYRTCLPRMSTILLILIFVLGLRLFSALRPRIELKYSRVIIYLRDEGNDVRRCIVIRLNIPHSEDHGTSKTIRRSKTRRAIEISPRTKIRRASKISQRLEEARKQLGALCNNKLLSELELLNQKERKLKALVLLYLSEIDRRELYLPMGYSSLFDFCTVHLKHTRATAARRIRSARTAARYPEALDLLVSGEINITTLAMVSDILAQNNHVKILSEIRGKSTREVEVLVSRHRPVNIIRDTVRPVCVMRRVEITPEASSPSAETNPATRDLGGGNGRSNVSGDSTFSAETKSAFPGRVILEQRLKLGFTVTPEFMKKYNKIKSLLSSKYPDGIDFETLFDILMSEYLEKHDPDKRSARRAERAGKRGEAATHDRQARRQAPAAHRSRRIPPTVRDQVYARDKGRCSFIGANGKRCNSTWDLEIDHVIPFASGGDNSPGNLRLLCRKHNSYQAERAYGRKFMNKHINSKETG
jgi:5-methylcytosine-specific restriction endonuclease McrA